MHGDSLETQLAELRGEMKSIGVELKGLRQELQGGDKSLREYFDLYREKIAEVSTECSALRNDLTKEQGNGKANSQRIERLEGIVIWVIRTVVGAVVLAGMAFLTNNGIN